MIGVLIPTRSRPESLKRTVDSIAASSSLPQAVRVYVGVDADDEVMAPMVGSSYQPPGLSVTYDVGPRPSSLGMLANRLWRRALADGCDLFVYGADDLEIATQGWDELARSLFAQVPDRLVLAYFKDPTDTQDYPTYGVVSREWTERLGYLFSEWFPYWWDDIWLDEIALLIGRKVRLPIELRQPSGRGKTTRMRELAFWARFFEATRPERIDAARRLVGDQVKLQLVPLLEQRNAPNCDPVKAAQVEARLADQSTPPGAEYLRAKAAAVAHLEKLAGGGAG